MHNAQVSSPISTKKRGFPLHKKCHITTCPQGRVIADLNDNDAQRKGKKRKRFADRKSSSQTLLIISHSFGSATPKGNSQDS